MAERFTDRVRGAAEPIWRAQHEHPLVRAIGEGTVDRERFELWLRQDYLFLQEYARLFALAAARAPDLETMRAFSRLAPETLETEMRLHRAYAAELGVSEAALAAESKAPTTQAYTDFLLRTAALGDFAELVAALLPCMWGFSEIGPAPKARRPPAEPLCAKWGERYASPGFAERGAWCRGRSGPLAGGGRGGG